MNFQNLQINLINNIYEDKNTRSFLLKFFSLRKH